MDNLQAKVVEHGLRILASDRAAADPLPGPLSQLFEDGGIRVGNMVVRKLYPIDEAIFRILDSPIHRMALEAQKPENMREDVPYTDAEEYSLALQFTTPPRDAYTLAKKGKQAFEDEAMSKFAFSGDLLEYKEVVNAIMEQLSRAFKTRMNYEPDKKDGESDAVPFPQPSVVQLTASDGSGK